MVKWNIHEISSTKGMMLFIWIFHPFFVGLILNNFVLFPLLNQLFADRILHGHQR